jgi:hypothetical protein
LTAPRRRRTICRSTVATPEAQMRTVIYSVLLAAALYWIDAHYFSGHYYFAMLRQFRG